MKITFNMATQPHRIETAKDTIDSIYDQSDEIRIYLNNFKDVPSCFKRKKIITYLGEDMRSSGKVYWALNPNEYYFCVDDDLIYPKSYSEDMIKKLNEYNDNIILSLHGKRLKEGIKKNYFRSLDMSLRCLGDVKSDTAVHIIGNGVSCWNTNKIKINYREFKYNYMDDISVSLQVQKQGKGALVMAHKEDYLTYNEPIGSTLFTEWVNNDQSHTEIINSIDWKLYI